MLAAWLRRGLAIEVAMLAAIAMMAARAGWLEPAAAAGAAVALFLGWRAVLIGAIHVLARWRGSDSPPNGEGIDPAFLRSLWREWVSYLALFVLIQPFEALWLGREGETPLTTGRRPALLVHGYLCNRGLWWWLARGLRARHVPVATVNLEPPFASIDRLAADLRERVDSLLAETGADRVSLVAHSMGGLVCRAYLQRHGPSRVANLVTLGAPHHGTWLARVGFGQNAREMRPDSEWIRRLTAEPLVPTLAIWSAADEFVIPATSGRLNDAREIVFPDLGHLTMAFSPRILRILEEELGSSA